MNLLAKIIFLIIKKSGKKINVNIERSLKDYEEKNAKIVCTVSYSY